MARTPSRRGDVAPFYVMELHRAAGERVAAGQDVVRLEAGQPSSGAPREVLAAAVAALTSDALGYTEAAGLPVLREAIAAHYLHAYGVEVDPARIVATMGSSSGFVLAFLAAFEVGARVAVGVPGYPAYRHTLTALGCEPVVVPTGPDTRYQLTPAHLETLGPLDGVIVASPANPTGTMLPAAELEALARWCREHDAWLVSDEIYHGLTYGQDAVTALASDPDAMVVHSFSKRFSMTGWRLGWVVAPEALVGPMVRLAQNLAISPPTLSQLAAVHAFEAEEELQGHVRRYAANRQVVIDGLRAAGLTRFVPPDGAFYVYVDVSAYTEDAMAFCHALLEAGVAATPGIDFDPERGRHHIRLSFAGRTEDVAEGCARLGRFVRGLRSGA